MHRGGAVNVDDLTDPDHIASHMLREQFGTADKFTADTTGATDVTAALIAAINALPASGGELFVPRGTYLVDMTAARHISRGNFILSGEGEATIFRQKPRVLSGATPEAFSAILTMSDDPAVRLPGVVFRDFAIDGNKAAHTGAPVDADTGVNLGEGLNLKRTTGARVENVTVRNTQADGFDIDDTTLMVATGYRAEGCGANGFHASSSSFRNVMALSRATNCGHAYQRSGFDQYTTSQDNVYVGLVAEDCYRGYNVQGSGALASGCRTINGAQADIWTGLAVDPALATLFIQRTVANIFTAAQVVQRDTTGGHALAVQVAGDTQRRLLIQADGFMAWGSGAATPDTTLYRSGADMLRTDDKMIAVAGLGAGNSATVTGTLGAMVRRVEIFGASGGSLGFIPIYSTIT
jgi:hypothetical protein